MDFFKSVFSDPTASASPSPSPSPPSSPNSARPSSSWQFGSTIFRTLASKSESLLDNYYKDLQEFSSGLTKETSVIREAASRAVQDLPSRLESGAAIAQESLEAVGQAIDDVGFTVSEIIGKDLNFAGHSGFSNLRLSENDDNSADSDNRDSGDSKFTENVKPYNRLEALIRSVQCDVRTYCDEIEGSGYGDRKLGFRVEEKREEIERLTEENAVIREIYDEVVPGKVDEETFWCRYFYRVDEVVEAEEARLRIVKRAFSGEDEEELSWDVDDEDDQENDGYKSVGDLSQNNVGEKGKKVESGSEVKGRDNEGASCELGTKSDVVVDEENLEDRLMSNEKESSDGKVGSDVSVISSQRSSHVEDDSGWDQMEDIGSSDEGKVGDGGSVSSRGVNLQKRLCNAEDDEVLTWDIEDDD